MKIQKHFLAKKGGGVVAKIDDLVVNFELADLMKTNLGQFQYYFKKSKWDSDVRPIKKLQLQQDQELIFKDNFFIIMDKENQQIKSGLITPYSGYLHLAVTKDEDQRVAQAINDRGMVAIVSRCIKHEDNVNGKIEH